MVKFHFIGHIEALFAKEATEAKSKVLETRFNLYLSNNLNKGAYYDADGLPSLIGIQALHAALVQGIAASTFYGHQKGWLDPREQYRKILAELQAAFLGYEHNEPMAAPGEFSAPEKPPRKSTDKELVIELVKRNHKGRYDDIIQMAVARWFHDFKAPENARPGDKIMLAEILHNFPELNDIREDVINGVYDEEPDDDDDKKRLGDLLLKPKE